jgi:hypothetical protein
MRLVDRPADQPKKAEEGEQTEPNLDHHHA